MDAPVTVFGGTGFLRREIVRAVLAAGLPVRIATRRRPDRAVVSETDGRISHVVADIRDELAVAAMQGDNVVGGRDAAFADLDIEPAGIASMLDVCLPRR